MYVCRRTHNGSGGGGGEYICVARQGTFLVVIENVKSLAQLQSLNTKLQSLNTKLHTLSVGKQMRINSAVSLDINEKF